MCSLDRMAALWNQVRYLDRAEVPGSLVECGVWKGGATAMMGLAHQQGALGAHRTLHLFDSFEGLPQPTRRDGPEATVYAGGLSEGQLESIAQCVGTLTEVRRLLEEEIQYPLSLLRYHRGWFQETVPRAAATIGPIALLRLDGDWYESTRICLEHLYPLVVPGGVVHVDDYGHWRGCREAVDEYLSRRGEVVLLNHIDYTGRFWVKLPAGSMKGQP
jgi:hypothetical protein